MFCHGCGAPLVDRAAFCSACGVPTQGGPSVGKDEHRAIHLAKDQKLRVVFGLAIVGLIVFAIWSSQTGEPPHAAVTINGPDYNPPKVTSRPSPSVNQPEAPLPSAATGLHLPQRYKIGEDFSVGYWFYRCNGARWQSMIPSLGGTLETPDAAFLVVDLSIRNNDRTASAFAPPKLIDAQGREHNSKSTSMPGALDILKQLNPGVSSRGYVVFDVPRGETYVLEVSGGFESGEHALVELSSPTQSEHQTANTGGQAGFATSPTQDPSASLDSTVRSATSAAPLGPHHFVVGVLRNVHCDNPAMSLSVMSGGNVFKLYTSNYFSVAYSVLDVTLNGDLNPCADLEGRPAKVEYVDSQDPDTVGFVVGIELHSEP